MNPFGWDYEINIDIYLKNMDTILEFSENMDKIDIGNGFGCGFMLAFFAFSEIELSAFQKEMGHFPYDSYLDLWEEFVRISKTNPSLSKLFNPLVPNYHQRNYLLEVLVKDGYIKKVGDCYSTNFNPFTKYMNRNKNLIDLEI